jgi:hypothetical protein
LGQRFQFAVELELALSERLSQINQKLLPEEAAKNLDGEEERVSASDPA